MWATPGGDCASGAVRGVRVGGIASRGSVGRCCARHGARQGDWSASHSALGMANKCKRIAETLHNLTDSVYIASDGLKSVSAMGSGASVYPGTWDDTLPCYCDWASWEVVIFIPLPIHLRDRGLPRRDVPELFPPTPPEMFSRTPSP